MKKANEMKNATIAVKEAQETAIRELAERYAESVVMAEIEKASAEGWFKVALRKESEINFQYLLNIHIIYYTILFQKRR